MSAVIGTRPRIYLACARSLCEAPNLGPTKGSRPAEWGRPTCRRPVCRCGVVAARCADGVRSGGVSGRAAALQALRCASYRPRGGCTRVYKKMLSCTVPCTRQVWTLCVILSDLNRPELCFIEWHWSLCALLTSKFTVRDPNYVLATLTWSRHRHASSTGPDGFRWLTVPQGPFSGQRQTVELERRPLVWYSNGKLQGA